MKYSTTSSLLVAAAATSSVSARIGGDVAANQAVRRLPIDGDGNRFVSFPDTRLGLPSEYFTGNPNCQDLGYNYGWKMEGCKDRPTSIPFGDLEKTGAGISCPSDTYLQGKFDLQCSDDGILATIKALNSDVAVFMKGGTGGTVYQLEKGVSATIDVGQQKQISHIEFCFKCPEVVTNSVSVEVDGAPEEVFSCPAGQESYVDHEAADSVGELSMKVDVVNDKSHFNLWVTKAPYGPFDDNRSVRIPAYCVDYSRGIGANTYNFDVFSAFDPDIIKDYGAGSSASSAVDFPEYLPNLGWLMNNINIGDTYDDGSCKGVIDWNEYQVALWYVIDGVVVGDAIHSYYNQNNRQDCISQGLAALAYENGNGWEPDCDKPGERVPLLFIVDDSNNVINKQVLMGEAKITTIKGMCKCKAAPTAAPTEAPTDAPTKAPTDAPTSPPVTGNPAPPKEPKSNPPVAPDAKCVSEADMAVPSLSLYELAKMGEDEGDREKYFPYCGDLGQNEPFQGKQPLERKIAGETVCQKVNICHGNAGFGWNRITVDRDAIGINNNGNGGHAKFEHNDPSKNKRPDYFPGGYSVPNPNGAGKNGYLDGACNFIPSCESGDEPVPGEDEPVTEPPTDPPAPDDREGPGSDDGTKPPGVKGDPHFKTFAGELYDFHGECDLVLLHNPLFHNNKGMDIHIRTKIEDFWSSVETSALKIGDSTIEVQASPESPEWLWINGELVSPPRGEWQAMKFEGMTLRIKETSPSVREINLYLGKGSAEKLVMKTFKSFVRVDIPWQGSNDFVGSTGLLGAKDLDGQRVGRDGQTIIEDMHVFGQEWQVLSEEPQIFHSYEGAVVGQKCVMPPVYTEERAAQMKRRLAESGMTQEDAENACDHLRDAEEIQACVFDVLATQDLEMAGAW